MQKSVSRLQDVELAALGQEVYTQISPPSDRTSVDAYNIIVMSEGKIVEQGNHAQLLNKKGAYYNLVSAQKIEDETKQTTELLEEPLDEEEEMLIRRMSRYKNVGGFYTDPQDVAENMSTRLRRVSTAGGAMSRRKSASSMAMAKRGPITEEEPTYTLWTLIKFIASFNKTEWHWMLIGVFFSILAGGANPVQAGMSFVRIATRLSC